ncbi:MAG: hypothetical protein WAK55_16160, partial [Xanthobacteraceae bacterium]
MIVPPKFSLTFFFYPKAYDRGEGLSMGLTRRKVTNWYGAPCMRTSAVGVSGHCRRTESTSA